MTFVNPRVAYEQAVALTGRPMPSSERVGYQPTLTGRTRLALYIWGLAILSSSIMLLGWIGSNATFSPLGVAAVALMIAIELIRVAQTATLWVFARMACDPIPMVPVTGLRVAVHTTIVPGKEPFDLVLQTLLAMKAIRYAGGTVDVWLLDEGDDSFIKKWCQHNGVHHFSRKGVDEWNTPAGQFKARTKHGNLNSFHAAHGADYDIVAQMDPDHVPAPEFLERSLGYFTDPNVGFVVAPQVYGNIRESFIARASAFQAYVFHGIIQRGGNGLRAPLLIGTNHLVRTQMLRDVGGYADSIIEDHLTSMMMFAKRNPATGDHWQGVYTPDVLSVGEGPTSFTDYFSQQQRWAYGIWQIATSHSPTLFGGMKQRQALAFAMLQLFYPSVAIGWMLSICLTGIFLTGLVEGRPVTEWVVIWSLSMASTFGFFLWLRQFNLVEHERKDWGLSGMSLLLMCIPVYVKAGAQALRRKTLTYAVTAKGDLASPDSLRTFTPHLGWATVALVMLGISLSGIGSSFVGIQFWLGWMMAISLLAPVAWMGQALRGRLRAVTDEPDITAEDLPRALSVVDNTAGTARPAHDAIG